MLRIGTYPKQIWIKGFLLFLLCWISCHFFHAQDSLIPSEGIRQGSALRNSGFLNVLSGGLNGAYRPDGIHYGIDLAVQTYHYYLITGRKSKFDSIGHQQVKLGKKDPSEIYRGFDFYLLSRVSFNLDSLKGLVQEYLTSLLASPFTLRINKNYYLSRLHQLNPNDYSPVISLNLIADARIIPYHTLIRGMRAGASLHGFLGLSTFFKRIEFNGTDQIVDKGTLYFKPVFGFAFGSSELMSRTLRDNKLPILFSSECRLGFTSEALKFKDCSLLLRYIISEVYGPQLRFGILLRSFR
ncbi:MAG: hypothetical protein EP338_06155 [Bacteroidetes bacterium]|nr:MAG: hypothetical protein EP338_06155 [Bacteroidota bacterium]